MGTQTNPANFTGHGFVGFFLKRRKILDK